MHVPELRLSLGVSPFGQPSKSTQSRCVIAADRLNFFKRLRRRRTGRRRQNERKNQENLHLPFPRRRDHRLVEIPQRRWAKPGRKRPFFRPPAATGRISEFLEYVCRLRRDGQGDFPAALESSLKEPASAEPHESPDILPQRSSKERPVRPPPVSSGAFKRGRNRAAASAAGRTPGPSAFR